MADQNVHCIDFLFNSSLEMKAAKNGIEELITEDPFTYHGETYTNATMEEIYDPDLSRPFMIRIECYKYTGRPLKTAKLDKYDPKIVWLHGNAYQIIFRPSETMDTNNLDVLEELERADRYIYVDRKYFRMINSKVETNYAGLQQLKLYVEEV